MRGAGPIRKIALVTALFAFACGPARSQDVIEASDVEVLIGSRETAADGGGAITLPIRLSNRTGEILSVTQDVALPAGWSLATKQDVIAVPANETVSRFLLLRVPQAAPAGRYAVRLIVSDLAGRMLHSVVHDINVRVRCSVALELQSDAKFVEEGGQITIQTEVRNSGNVPLHALLHAQSHSGHRIVIDKDTLALAPASSQNMAIRVHVTDRVKRKTRRSATLTARPIGCGESPSEVSRTVSFDVLPAAGDAAQARTVIPASLSLSGGSGSSGIGGHIDLSVSGYVDREEKREIGIQIRLPDDRVTRFGRRSLLKARYATSNVAVAVGDFRTGYGLLSRPSGVGRGVSIDARHKGLRGGAFWSRPQYRFPIRAHSGVMVGIARGEQVSARALFSRQTGVDSRESVTLMASIAPVRDAELTLEYGDSFRGSSDASAASIQLVGSQRGLTYSGRYIHAGPRFPGQFANYEFTQGSLTVRPMPGLHVSTGGRLERRTFDAGGEDTASQKSNELYDVGVGWRVRSARTEISTTATAALAKRSLSGPSAEVTDQRHAGLELRIVRPAFAIGAKLQRGHYVNRVVNLTDMFTRTTFSARVGNSSHSVGLALEWTSGRMISRPLIGSVVGGHFTMETRVADRLRVEADAFVSRDGFWAQGVYRLLDVRALRALRGGGQISLRAVHSSFGPSSTASTDLGLMLRLPLTMPNPLATRLRRFEGRVIDHETGQPLAAVLAQLGDQHALTDSNGRFAMTQPDGGEYLFRVDMSTVGVAYVPMVEMPLTIDFDRHLESHVEVSVARAASVSVEVGMLSRQATLVNERNDSGAAPVVPLNSAVVEIQDAIGRYRAVTNVAGKTTFMNVRPGEYAARIVHAILPPHYETGVDFSFRVEPGGKARVVLTAVPTRRQIRMISLRNGDPKSTVDTTANTPRTIPPCRSIETRVTSHVVQDGETLSSIAVHYYGEPLIWPLIWLANRSITDDPDLIRPGNELEIETPGPTFDPVEFGRQTEYVTSTNDSLPSIAARFTGDARLWPMIWWANRSRIADPETLPANLTLRWPTMRLVALATTVCDDK